MLTLNQLKTYIQYKGDGDMYARLGKQSTEHISGTEWSLIDSLIQDLIIAKNGHLSQDYIVKLNERIVQNLDSDETINYLKSLVK